MKTLKYKSLVMLMAFIAFVSIIGAGFAAWIITAPANEEAPGSITVEQVTIRDLGMTVEFKDLNENEEADDNVIHFGASSKGDSWLTNDLAAESLKATLVIKVQNIELLEKVEFNVTSEKGGKVTIGETVYEGYQGAYELGYVAALPTLPTLTDANFQQVADADYYVCEVEVEFTWGTAFGGLNPMNYYAEKEYTNNAEQAFTQLDNLYKLLSGDTQLNGNTDNAATYNISVTATLVK